MKFSVNIHAALSGTNLSTIEKMKLSADLGFSAVEFWTWWNEDLEEVASYARQCGLSIASVCTKFFSLVDPSQRDSYLEGLKESIEAASKLGCRYLISQTGNAIPGKSREKQSESLIEGLMKAVALLEKTNIALVVEPLNLLVDHPGYFLAHAEEAADLIGQVNSPHVKILYDVYHQQVTEGNLIPTIRKHTDRIGYFHIADHPGRHEPGSGEINYHNVLKAIQDTGYKGFIGLEYFPSAEPARKLQTFMEVYGGYERQRD